MQGDTPFAPRWEPDKFVIIVLVAVQSPRQLQESVQKFREVTLRREAVQSLANRTPLTSGMGWTKEADDSDPTGHGEDAMQFYVFLLWLWRQCSLLHPSD